MKRMTKNDKNNIFHIFFIILQYYNMRYPSDDFCPILSRSQNTVHCKKLDCRRRGRHFERLSTPQLRTNFYQTQGGSTSDHRLTLSLTASSNSTAKGLIYVFKNRRSSSAAAYAFNRLSSGQFHSNRRQTREKRSSGSTLRLSCPPCWVSIVKCLVDATKSRQTAIVALCIFDKPLRLNQLKQHRKNEYRGAPTVAEQHPTVISRPTHRNRVVPQNTQKRLQLKHLTRCCSQTTWRRAPRLSRRLHQLKG